MTAINKRGNGPHRRRIKEFFCEKSTEHKLDGERKIAEVTSLFLLLGCVLRLVLLCALRYWLFSKVGVLISAM